MTLEQRPSFLRTLSFLIVKYILFFIVLGFLDDRYKDIVFNRTKGSDVVLAGVEYFLEILFTTFLLTLVLFVPFYLLFKLKKTLYILPAFLVLVVAEYFLYEATCSYIHLDIDGIINSVLSVFFFFLFFWKFLFEGEALRSTSRVSRINDR